MKRILIMLCLPVVAWAQPPPLEFQLQPDAFPASINGTAMQQPWAGGLDNITPTWCDLDADGTLDYFCGDYRGYVSYFQNTGTPTVPDMQYVTYFFDSLKNSGNLGLSTVDINFADIDGDGDLDAFMGRYRILLFYNIGDSSQAQFLFPPDTLVDATGSPIYANRCALADIDGDGKLDLFGGNYAGYLKYYHNIGTAQSYAFQLVSSNWFSSYTSEGMADPCFGDLDGDGDLDLLIGTGLGHVAYWRNDGTPQVPQMTPVPSTFLNIAVQKDASPELADLDGDGDLDLFVGRSSAGGQNPSQGDVYFYRNDGSPQQARFTYVTSNYLTWDCGYNSAPRLVDVNGDGLPDLLSCLGSHLIYYQNTGTSGYPEFVYQSSNYGGFNVFDFEPWFVDLNGDGLLDIIAGTSAIPGPPMLKLYLNQGTSQTPNWVLVPGNPVQQVFSTTSVHLSPWTADIDGDGTQDLFVSDQRGYVYYFHNSGTSAHYQFQYITNNWQGLNDGIGGFHYGCFYDMDSDGDLDLFMNSQADSSVWELNLRFYRNQGTPQSPDMILEDSALFPEWFIGDAAPFAIDIDQDGDGDLFVGDTWGGCRFFRNTGGSFVHPDPKRPEGPPERMITVLPNPGNSGTTITYILDHPQKITLDIFNLLGAKVASLASGLQLPGNYSYTWDASAKASGIYILRFATPDQSVSRKITILK